MAFSSVSGGSKTDVWPQSNLLQALRATDYDLLHPYLVEDAKLQDDLLYMPGNDVTNVYFPCGPSLVSYLVVCPDGREVQAALVGREGAVGGIVSRGNLPAYCRIIVKFGGPFVRMPIARLEEAKRQSETLRSLFARYADCLLAQIFQSTACNAIHSIEQRTAKWILAAMERTGDQLLPLTHEELASMLGVGRSYASRVLQSLKSEGILETRRGALVVRDQDRLVRKSCPCNDSVKAHFDVVLRGVYPEANAPET